MQKRLKIALVCPYDIAYPGGVQSQVLQFAECARKAGHNVLVIAASSEEGNREGVYSAGKAIPVPVGMGTVARITFSFWNRHSIRKILTEGRFDVVHVHSPEAPILGPLALLYADTKKSALVTTSHSNISPNLVTWGYVTFAKMVKLLRLLEKVHIRLAVSPAAASRAQYYLPWKHVIIPNGIDTERFSPKAKPVEKYMDGKLNILFVGRLGNSEKRKGLYYLVSAFNELHKKHPNTKLLVVGPGEPDIETKALLIAAQNSDIVFTGPVPSDELPRYYQTAHIFAATPTDGESFSMVVAEAMSSGKPVITSNMPGPRDVLLGYKQYGSKVANSKLFAAEAGILVKPRDVKGIAAALERLVLNDGERKRMGIKGRQIVVRKFSWKVVAPQILAVYRKAVANKKAVANAAKKEKRRGRDFQPFWLSFL